MLAEQCAAELKTATTADPMAVQKGFELVGQVAMQELMTNQETMAALTAYVQYTDQDKINKVLAGD